MIWNMSLLSKRSVVNMNFLSRSNVGRWRARAKFDPGLTELRAAGVTMTATLACFFSARLGEDFAHLHTDVVVLAVALAVSLGRTQRGSDHRGRPPAGGLVPGGG